MNDPEHMEALELAGGTKGKGPAPLPPLAGWTNEVDMLATVNDSLLMVKDAIVRSNVAKDKQNAIPAIAWTPRPGRPNKPTVSNVQKAEQMARHKHAVSLFLPGKAEQDD